MADAASRGDQLVKDAEKRLSSWGFNKQAKYEDAADLFAKAGAQYKIEKNYEKAGNAFKSAGQNSEKAGNMAEALQNYQNAGKAYAQDAETLDEAIKTYEMVVRMLTESNRFSQAAKLCKEIGSLYEQDMKTDKAIEKYEQAAHYFQSEDSKTTANQCLLLAADLLAGQEQYKKAVETYEKVATASLESALTKWSVTEYLFKASICQLVMDARQGSGRCPLAQIAVDKYLDLHPPFETSREYKLLKTIFEAFEASNVQAFTDALFDYNQVSPLDNFKSGMLLKVKRLMVESDDTAAAKVAAGANPNDDDEPNWT